VKIEANANDASPLTAGDAIAMTVRGLGQKFSGAVRGVSPSPDGANRSEVVVDVADPDGLLTPNLAVDAEIFPIRGQ